jgi:hypothetical protein
MGSAEFEWGFDTNGLSSCPCHPHPVVAEGLALSDSGETAVLDLGGVEGDGVLGELEALLDEGGASCLLRCPPFHHGVWCQGLRGCRVRKAPCRPCQVHEATNGKTVKELVAEGLALSDSGETAVLDLGGVEGVVSGKLRAARAKSMKFTVRPCQGNCIRRIDRKKPPVWEARRTARPLRSL